MKTSKMKLPVVVGKEDWLDLTGRPKKIRRENGTNELPLDE